MDRSTKSRGELQSDLEIIRARLAKREGHDTFETKHKTKEGGMPDVLVRAAHLSARGRSLIGGIWRNATRQKRAESAPGESEEGFSAIFDQAAVGVAQIDTHTGRVVKVNRKYCDIVGIKADDMIARTFMGITHPDDLQADLDNMERLKAGEIREFSMEKRYIRPDGSVVWVNHSVSPMWKTGEQTEHHIAVAQDITGRKLVEEALRQSEQRFRHAFEAAVHGMALVSPHGRWLKINRALCDIVGYSEAELLEADFQSITHREDLGRDLEHLRMLLAGEISSYNTEKRYIHKRGHAVWIRLSASVVHDAAQKPVHIIAHIEDITARKQAEKLAELAARVDAGLTIEEVLEQVFEAFREVIPYERIGCALVEDGGRTARSVYARSIGSEIELPAGYSAPLKGSSLETVLEGKRPRILDDLEAHLRERPESDSTRRMVAEGMRSSLTCPLVAMGKAVGFLFFSSTKPHAYSGVHAEIYLRIAERLSLIVEKGRLYQELIETKQLLKTRGEFIEEAFGRYMSEEVASQILASPRALKIGGEMRKVTILMSDLRGFADLCAELDPQQVIRLLNVYLEAMTDVIMRYQGTIDEFQGDSILAIFGAPVDAKDHARRALACALSMQRAMEGVNTQLTEEGLPALDLGIGVHTGEVVVGNIGSRKRAKYGIVGAPVNLVSRIQACTSGGQILCSENTLREAGDAVQFNERVEIRTKGFLEPVATFSVCGLRDRPELSISKPVEALVTLTEALPVHFQAVEEKQIRPIVFQGRITMLSHAEAEIHSVAQIGCPFQPLAPEKPCPLLGVARLTDLVLFVDQRDAFDCEDPIYAKVTQAISDQDVRVRFNSLSPTAVQRLERLLAQDHARPRTVGGCWEADYSASTNNDATQFKAKAD
jgi:PAS domain S-box-containing protein